MNLESYIDETGIMSAVIFTMYCGKFVCQRSSYEIFFDDYGCVSRKIPLSTFLLQSQISPSLGRKVKENIPKVLAVRLKTLSCHRKDSIRTGMEVILTPQVIFYVCKFTTPSRQIKNLTHLFKMRHKST